MKTVCILLIAMVSATIVAAQSDPRPEFRIVNHWQRFSDNKNEGFAAYVNEPDVVHGGPRVFGVAGFALRDKAKTRWLEVMGGGLANSAGFDPALDLRAQAKLNTLQSLILWGEYLHLFNSDRTLISASLTKVFHKRLKLGAESDTWKQKVGSGTTVGPGAGVILTQHLQIWSAYHFGVGQRDIWRTYFVVNW